METVASIIDWENNSESLVPWENNASSLISWFAYISGNNIVSGYMATFWMQSDASPTPLSVEELSLWNGYVATIVGPDAGGIGSDGISVPVEEVPDFGSDDAFSAYAESGERTGNKITSQNALTSLAITSAWNPSDPALLQIYNDGKNGRTVRTYVVAIYDGTNTSAYAFNARIGGVQFDLDPDAESQFIFNAHPIGDTDYGWSNS